VAAKRRHQLLTSPHAIEEARRNLQIKEPRSLPRFEPLLRQVQVCPECREDSAARARDQSLPEKDVPILGAALQARADLLVTGDRSHFGHLYGRTIDETTVATPAEALAALLRR